MSATWEFNLKFTLQSGQAFTPINGYFLENLPGSSQQNYRTIPGVRNGGRYPSYHRLDIGAVWHRKKYDVFYAVTDDKFKKEDFEKKVKKENQLVTKGIEVGHIFYFGDKYSKPLKCSVDLQGGKKVDVKMGSYGIGVSRLVGAIIEAKYDEKQEIMKWPISVAPYDCAILPLINKNDSSNLEKANKLYNFLNKNKINVIIDDTDESFSSKIKKFNLIGIPNQIMIGKKSEGDIFEYKEIGKDTQNLPISQIAEIITNQKK